MRQRATPPSGMCIHCWHEPHSEGTTLCDACRIKAAVLANRRAAKRREAAWPSKMGLANVHRKHYMDNDELKVFILSHCKERLVRDDLGPCMEWQRMGSRLGYGRIKVAGKTMRVHRVLFECLGYSVDGLMVCHKCDNKLCCRPDHLFLGTAFDNMQDMSRKGRSKQQSGELHHNAVLTNGDVLAIRASNKSRALLAAEYGVNRGTIRDIILRKSWRHI